MEEGWDCFIEEESNLWSDEENQDAETPEVNNNEIESHSELQELNIHTGHRIRFGSSAAENNDAGSLELCINAGSTELTQINYKLSINTEINAESTESNTTDTRIDVVSQDLQNNIRNNDAGSVELCINAGSTELTQIDYKLSINTEINAESTESNTTDTRIDVVSQDLQNIIRNNDAGSVELCINAGSTELTQIDYKLSINTEINAESTESNTTDTRIDVVSQDLQNNISRPIRPQTAEMNMYNSAGIPSAFNLLTCRIGRVPQQVRVKDESAYTPSIVSIGPFHYKKTGLEDMEARKLNYLHRMLGKDNNTRDLLSTLHGAMKELEPETRKCYLDEFNTINSDDFVRMMVVDSCFIIELFRLNAGIRSGQQVYDPIFETPWIVANLRQDLLMLENQLPLFVLQKMLRLTGYPDQEGGSFLNELALKFFVPLWPSNEPKTSGTARSTIEGNYQHLLAVFHSSFIPSEYNSETTLNRRFLNQYSTLSLPVKGWVRNAENLKQAGLILQRKSGKLLDIQLQGSRLKIPKLLIGVRNQIVLRNLLAYERSNCYAAPYFTSIVMLFYSLVDTPQDVQLLRNKGILGGVGSGNDEEVVALFSSLSEDIVLDPNDCLIAKQVRDINRYCRTPRAAFCIPVNKIFGRLILAKVLGSSLFLYLVYHYLV